MSSHSLSSPVRKPRAEDRFNAGVRRHLLGDLDGALRVYDEVLVKWPTYAEAHNNAGAIRGQFGDTELAIAHFRSAVALQPDYADAHHNLGLVLLRTTDRDGAIASLQQAVECAGDRASWWTDLANAFMDEQRCDEALVAYDRAVALAPDDVVAVANRAVALRGLRRHPEAIAACNAALALRPEYLDALSNLGLILKETRDFPGARQAFERALMISPTHVAVRVNLAVLLMELNRHAEAQTIAMQLLEENPAQVEPWNVLGNCAFERADWDEAERCHLQALALDPADRNANWNMAVLTLLRGDFTEGFKRFEARKRLVSVLFSRRRYDVPEWDGSPLAGHTIFVHAEQGLGDVLQFVRFALELKARGAGRVIVECALGVAPLVRTAPGVDEIVIEGTAPPAFHTHAYLMSLPLLCGTTIDTVPATAPYLAAPTRPVADLVRTTGAPPRVGLVWAGNPLHQRDLIRSVSLEALAPVLQVPGVTFVSLQKGVPTTQLAGKRGILNLDPFIHDLGDTAAAIAELDLVITVDTAVAHLAGALGKPVWVLLPHVPDWRWMIERADSPWYPSMRLFRQPNVGAWGAAIARVADDLAALAAPDRSPETGDRSETGGALQQPPVSLRSPVSGLRSEAAPERRPIEISWPIGLTSGWGTYGLQLAMALHRSARAEPVLMDEPTLQGVGADVAREVNGMRRAIPGGMHRDAVRLTALGNHFLGASRPPQAAVGVNAGVIFFEDTSFDADAMARAHSYDVIVAGSSWNAAMLKAYGLPEVRLVLQGIDPAIFRPAPKTGRLGDRFFVFSGGKLEFRKGQDIVVEAFKRFRATHPDATLVTAWHNHWPQTMAGIESAGWVKGLPAVNNGRCDITGWLMANGLPSDAILDLGVLPQASMAQALHEMDVAVFTNRCEGGTNLVAMEAMACGVPTILSANTGHLNLIGRDTCFPLEHQETVTASCPLYTSTLGWGESDPDEVVALLERAYDDRAEARRRGDEGARLLAQLPWPKQADELLRQLGV